MYGRRSGAPAGAVLIEEAGPSRNARMEGPGHRSDSRAQFLYKYEAKISLSLSLSYRPSRLIT